MLKTPPLATPKPRLQFLRGTTINSVTNHHTRRKIIRCQHSDSVTNRKPRILCLHGFRTSGQIFKTQMNKWPQSVLNNLDLFFPDAPFDSNGKSGVEGVFDPPYYEWFQFHKDYKRYENFDECVEYIEECMIQHAPIDGLLGFSQVFMLIWLFHFRFFIFKTTRIASYQGHMIVGAGGRGRPTPTFVQQWRVCSFHI
ncbi:putative serine hydrolase FSH, alpha/Beta hydrolase [Helianthus annuus]|nr:putative serine hydrolase FSH, alpha/Beta hydrolase [Helianthus annuus]